MLKRASSSGASSVSDGFQRLSEEAVGAAVDVSGVGAGLSAGGLLGASGPSVVTWGIQFRD